MVHFYSSNISEPTKENVMDKTPEQYTLSINNEIQNAWRNAHSQDWSKSVYVRFNSGYGCEYDAKNVIFTKKD